MSYAVLMTLTIVEIVALVVVLASYLILLTSRLESIAHSLSRVTWGVRAVEVELSAVGPAVEEINGTLTELTDDLLPGVAAKATVLAS